VTYDVFIQCAFLLTIYRPVGLFVSHMSLRRNIHCRPAPSTYVEMMINRVKPA